MKRMSGFFSPRWALVLLLLLSSHLRVLGQVWQWSTPVPHSVSSETNDQPRAFLWIPPCCRQVRAVVVGQHNMLEEGVLEHPQFREELARLGIAEVWVSPMPDMVFDFQHGAGERFSGMMQALAEQSGYQELAMAPVVAMGHSAAASFPWNFAAWNPARTLAVISLKGDAPQTTLTGSGRPNPDWHQRTLDGVPGLMVMGEYEWLEPRLVPALAYRAQHPAAPITLLADVGHGHFDFSDELVRYLALYIRKAAALRLPAHPPLAQPTVLKPIDTRKGWLADRWRNDAAPQAPAAPASAYKGNLAEAFWYFDRELAAATEQHYARQRGKQPQLLGFVQQGRTQPQINAHQQVNLQFEPLSDGISFRVGSTFLDTVPSGNANPARWAKRPAGSPITHAAGPINVSRITGPIQQTSPDTWTLSFNKVGFNNVRRSNDVWLLASHPGDATHKSAVQQANLKFPLRNTEGIAQHISFPALADVSARRLKRTRLTLAAISDAGLPVRYYVQEGPAEVAGNMLRFTALPLRAKYPMKVVVVAWQYGHRTVPQVQTAEPVVQTFYIR